MPVAWVVALQNTTEDIALWLEQILNMCYQIHPDWKPNAFMVDDVLVDSVCKIHIKKHVNLDATARDRDFFLSRADVANIYCRLSKGNYQLHKKDEMSVSIWYQKCKEDFLFFQKPNDASVPFIIGIQMKWMLGTMVKLCHNNLIAMDSTFSTNKYGVCVFPMVFLI